MSGKTRDRQLFRPSALQSGVLVLWNDSKGFGFVRPDKSGEGDWFVHISVMKKGMERRPVAGDKVLFAPDIKFPEKRKLHYLEISGMPYGEVRPDVHGVMQQPMSVYMRMVVIMPFVLSLYLIWETHNPVPLFSYGFFSVLTMMLYGADKTRSLSGQWRFPEVYFHILQLLGGWPGGLIAQNDFRHKRRKSSYQRIFWMTVAVHAVIWIFVIVHFYDRS